MASKRMLDAAGVKYRKLESKLEKLELSFKASDY